MKPSNLTVTVTLAAALLLSACTKPVSVESKWSEEAAGNERFDNFLVVGVTLDYNIRCRYERMMAARLRESGVKATSTCDFMDPEDPLTEEGVQPALEKTAADVVLVTELLGKHAEVVEGGTNEARGEAYYKPIGYGYAYRYPYYGGYGLPVPVTYVDFRVEKPVFEIEASVAIASNLFETERGDLIYSVQTTAHKRRTREEVLDVITAGTAKRLRWAGITPGIGKPIGE